MPRYHGKTGALYMAATGGTAVSVANLSEWTLDASRDKVEVTAFTDGNKVRVLGLPDYAGTFSGWFADDDTTIYVASEQNTARFSILYPATTALGKNWSGLAWIDYSITTPVAGGVAVKGTISAAGTWTRV